MTVSASREGFGRGTGSATVRLTDAVWAGAVAAEGGAITDPIGGPRRPSRAGDGRAAPAGVPVVLRGPRLGPDAARGALARDTDADGVARFDLPPLAAPAGEGGDPCGGETATSLTARIGDDSTPTAVAACIPLDPDAAARVRVSPQTAPAGAHIRVDLVRAPAAAGLPVLVSLLVREEGGPDAGLRALASHVVPAGADTTELALPADAVGVVLVRARPLVGPERLEVRGGSTALWITPGERAGTALTLDGSGRRATLAFRGAQGDRSAVVYALPVDEARALALALSNELAGPLGDLRRPETDAGESLLGAALALATPPDLGAPAVLRGRERVAVPAPDAPERLGLLRDPWRARARFVGGRLALLFRALEQAVVGAVPGRLADVAVRTPRGWDFNELVLESVRGEALGDAGATGLGGEPLTIDALRRLDPAFTYDHVAQRITRQRLWTMLLALRQLVQQSSLDLRWTVRGDPAEWLTQASQLYFAGGGPTGPKRLVDAWGTPLALRPASGGRARFSQVEPVVGYELVSAGPDTRFGTGDDLWDPTAAVLPPGSLYAEAVGEAALVARLRGVELGRATVELLTGAIGVGVGWVPAQAAAAPVSLLGDAWQQLPTLRVPDPLALALRRPALPGDGAGGALGTLPSTGGPVALDLDAEPRTWGAVALTLTQDGVASVALGESPGGAPALVAGALPERIRIGERIAATLTLTDARPPSAGGGDVRYAVQVTAPEGVEIDTLRELVVPAEQSATLPVALTAGRAARGTVRLVLTVAGSEVPARTLTLPLVADGGLHPLRARATGLARAGAPFETALTLPAGVARGPRASCCSPRARSRRTRTSTRRGARPRARRVDARARGAPDRRGAPRAAPRRAAAGRERRGGRVGALDGGGGARARGARRGRRGGRGRAEARGRRARRRCRLRRRRWARRGGAHGRGGRRGPRDRRRGRSAQRAHRLTRSGLGAPLGAPRRAAERAPHDARRADAPRAGGRRAPRRRAG